MMLFWPTQSSDLNPIKNLWAEIKTIVQYHTLSPSNIRELEKYIKNA